MEPITVKLTVEQIKELLAASRTAPEKTNQLVIARCVLTDALAIAELKRFRTHAKRREEGTY